MAHNPSRWEEITPDELLPAIRHIVRTFDLSYFKCSDITETLCYAHLHPQEAAAAATAAEYGSAFLQYRALLGNRARQEFDDLLRIGTPPSVFKAYFDAFCKGMEMEVRRTFADTLQIGLANTTILRLHPVEWARTHLNILIESKSRVTEHWVKSVCDKQDRPHTEDSKRDFEEAVFWRTWRAPMLIHMRPSAATPYDPENAWTRRDEEETSKLLEHFSGRFSDLLGFALDRIAGDTYIELAKRGKPRGHISAIEKEPQHTMTPQNAVPQSAEYPREFSSQARALVEAEKLKARRQFVEDRTQTPWSKHVPSAMDEKNFQRYILQVFLVFGHEACKLGEQRLWNVERIRAEVDEFLRRFTIHVYYADGHDKHGRKLPEMVSHLNGSLLPEVRREFEKSDEWRKFEEDLLAVAEQLAQARPSETELRDQGDVDANQAGMSATPLVEAENVTPKVEKLLTPILAQIDTPLEGRIKRKRKRKLAKRDTVIFAAILMELKGMKYCSFLQGCGIKPKWSDSGPATYPQSYQAGDPWRKKVQDEKTRARPRMDRYAKPELAIAFNTYLPDKFTSLSPRLSARETQMAHTRSGRGGKK